MLQNLPTIWNVKTHVGFFLFKFEASLSFFSYKFLGHFNEGKIILHEMKKKGKSKWVFVFQSYYIFTSIPLGHFIKHMRINLLFLKNIVTMLYGKYILLPLCIIFAKLLSNLAQLIFLLNAAALLKVFGQILF